MPDKSDLSSRDRILLSARSLFATQGYEHATTSAIARTAGTSESQLIKHFGSKEGLLEAIFDQAWSGVGEGLGMVMKDCATPFDQLRALSELMIAALEKDRDLRLLLLLEGRRIRKHGSMVVLTQGFLRLVTTIDRILAEMQRGGQLRAGLNVQAVRSALIGALEGLLRDQALAERGSFPAVYDAADLRAAFRLFLDCFVPRNGHHPPPGA